MERKRTLAKLAMLGLLAGCGDGPAKSAADARDGGAAQQQHDGDRSSAAEGRGGGGKSSCG